MNEVEISLNIQAARTRAAARREADRQLELEQCEQNRQRKASETVVANR